ncbi:branched-chain amino acid ABC transporter permease [Brevibacillus choshinensis]|uniref:branched-chain amino acid ABC transporter permease n=1 Tax=Brevibacillus choshinensis TaxID=54911 RepID=UPI002E1C63E4|nr:branched-chain amino acid ABC transporter permease [Brevibacillus choshinensis]MED4753248.1 branched-chain amino acid ABC transporter permease [Brevibacillus choshinensis]
MSAVLLPLVNGLSQAMLLFLIASGLTLVFGVLGILNFSHGAFFMIGAYVGYSLIQGQDLSIGYFFLVVVLAGIAVGLLGMLIEVIVLRRIYKVDEIFALIATFAVLLILEGGAHQIWGANYLSVSFPQGLEGGLNLFDMVIPAYSITVIVIGLVIGAIIYFTLQKTSFGKLIRAAAADAKMTNALGVNVPMIYTSVFIAGAFLAGVAGLIAAPTTVLTPTLGMTFIIQAFGAVVVGGLGSIPGALVASVVLSLIDSYLTSFVPSFAGVAFFFGMVIMLMIKPKGILA